MKNKIILSFNYSSAKCGCHWPLHPCALCTGRSDPTAPRDLPDTMPMSERIALLDQGYHPVLSFTEGKYYIYSYFFFGILNIQRRQFDNNSKQNMSKKIHPHGIPKDMAHKKLQSCMRLFSSNSKN